MLQNGAKQMIDALGGIKAVAETLRLPYQTVASWWRRGVIPAAWYRVLDEMCREKGLACPLEAFNFREAA